MRNQRTKRRRVKVEKMCVERERERRRVRESKREKKKKEGEVVQLGEGSIARGELKVAG